MVKTQLQCEDPKEQQGIGSDESDREAGEREREREREGGREQESVRLENEEGESWVVPACIVMEEGTTRLPLLPHRSSINASRRLSYKQNIHTASPITPDQAHVGNEH